MRIIHGILFVRGWNCLDKPWSLSLQQPQQQKCPGLHPEKAGRRKRNIMQNITENITVSTVVIMVTMAITETRDIMPSTVSTTIQGMEGETAGERRELEREVLTSRRPGERREARTRQAALGLSDTFGSSLRTICLTLTGELWTGTSTTDTSGVRSACLPCHSSQA